MSVKYIALCLQTTVSTDQYLTQYYVLQYNNYINTLHDIT